MQNPSRIVLIIGLLAASSAAGIAYFAFEPANAQVSVAADTPGDNIVAETRILAPEQTRDTSGQDSTRSEQALDPPLVNLTPTEKGFGTISGGIRVSTKLIKNLKAYKIIVQETRNTNALKPGDPAPFYKYKTFLIDWSKGTPFFDIPEIPFSDHTYRVTVAVEGMNGSSAYINLTNHHPNGKDGPLQLALTPGTIFSVILRDQRRIPRGDIEVHMIPTGDSITRRKRHDGKTNNFGNVIFQDVERGDYTLTVGNVGAPSAPPETVTVYSSAASFANGRPRVQGKTVIVPDGKNVTIEVWSRHGFPLEDANLRAWQLEIKRFYDFKGKTDRAGRLVFENVPYGKYQISVDSSLHGRRDRKFEVTKGAGPVLITVKMPR